MVGALPDMFRSVCWSWSCRSRTQPPVCNSVGVDFNTRHRSSFFRGLNLVSVDVARLLDGRDRRPTACDRLKLDLGSEAVADFAAETAEDNRHKRKQWSVRKKNYSTPSVCFCLLIGVIFLNGYHLTVDERKNDRERAWDCSFFTLSQLICTPDRGQHQHATSCSPCRKPPQLTCNR